MNAEIKCRMKQCKGDNNMRGSPNLGYAHGEIANPSFYYIQQNEDITTCNTFIATSSSLSHSPFPSIIVLSQ